MLRPPTTTHPLLLPLFPLLALLAACADKGDSGAEVEDPLSHACEYTAELGSAVTAGADRASAPAFPLGEEPATVTLVPGATGYLKVEVTGDTAALLFAGTADVVNGLSQGDSAATLPTGAPNERCADDIPEHFDLDFHEAGDWYIEVGPAAIESVWLMLTSAEGHTHDE
jgi:hypothetical protein